MTSSPRKPLPRPLLFDLLPATFAPWGSSGSYLSRPPTRESVEQIESALGLGLPRLFVEVAASCPSYGGWFGSIGDDYEGGNHILAINAAFREAGLASRYVLLNHGHDGDCDAWDVQEPASGAEPPIVYLDFDVDRGILRGLKPSASCFADYIDDLVRSHAPRCPVKGLRRRAKRALAVHDESDAG